MSDIYTYVRVFYLIWAFILFMFMVYWGVQDLFLGSKCGHIQLSPENYLFAAASLGSVFVLTVSLGELLLQYTPGGIRTFLPVVFLFPSTLAVHQGAFRVKMHRISVSRGLCEGPKRHKDRS